MVQLSFLSGKNAGGHCDVRHFPFVVGRASDADYRIEEEGIWDQHLRISKHPEEGFVLSVQPDAIASVNGQLVQQALLRNGDIISIGANQIRFLLGPTRQRSLAWREYGTWIAFAALCLGQIAVIYWLMAL
jgi:hypothetical protein